MPNGRNLSVIAAGLLGLLVAALAGGCLNINTDTSGWQEVAKAYAGSGSERDWAMQRAREAAIQKGLTVNQLDADYSVSPAQGEKCWWVDFRYRSSEKRHWPERFVVRVDMDGRTLVYDHVDAPPH